MIKKSAVAIAGVGGVGGLLVERLVRLGVGNIRITDPGRFEESNLNRQFGSSMTSLEKNKAEVVYEEIRNINPDTGIYYDGTGITSEVEADKLVDGCDLIIDEMDYGAWKESVFLQRAARRRGIYYLFSGAIGFGALLTNFDPQGMTLEEYNKIPPDIDLDSINELSVPAERILPVVPTYANTAMSKDMMHEIFTGRRPIPTCSVGVGLASILAASEAVNILLRRREIVRAPQYIYVDLLDHKFLVGTIS